MPFPDEQNQFKEGESGNPSGRPKGSRNRSTVAREMLALLEKVKNPITGNEEQLSQEEIMSLAILAKARKGDVRAYIALMDSAHGQAKQSLELGNTEKGVFKIGDQTIEF